MIKILMRNLQKNLNLNIFDLDHTYESIGTKKKNRKIIIHEIGNPTSLVR